MRNYFKNLTIPIILQILFTLSIIFTNERYYLYINFIFYLSIAIYFIKLGYFKLDKLKYYLRSGKSFWKPVLISSILFILAFSITDIIAIYFNIVHTGMIKLKVNSYFELLLFSFSTVILPPIAEELFYRKAMISFNSKISIFITSFLGMLLYGLEHSLSVFGIISAMIWAIPFTITYIKSKNIYITIVAHFIVNLIVNGTTIVFTLIKLLNI